jgi:hypothetical protein
MKRSPPEPGAGIVERPLYTDRELAERYRVHRSTIWNWQRAGIIEKVKIGAAARFRPVAAVEAELSK